MASKKSTKSFRLSRDVEPELYAIELTPDLKKFTFCGKEDITVNFRASTSCITLHAMDLKIHNASLSINGQDVLIANRRIEFNSDLETLSLHLPHAVKAGTKAKLHIEFEGILNDQMHGFYRTQYAVKSEKRWGCATQFEATDARRAFPCWDEPDRKAKFQVTLHVPDHLTALSNMPVKLEKVTRKSKTRSLTYDVTPVMSTYLLAFVVADLECIQAKDKNGVLIRVFTTPGKKKQAEFALEVALHTLPYFAEWFGTPYQLPKLDMVALPDFASGAMENWGLVTYRETALLVDPKQSSRAARQRVAEVIDHELAHQWFGNLVTMEWWTDLWLNEGFASFMGPKAVHHQFPEWRVWDQFLANEYLSALHDDSLKNSHPIEIEVKNPHEIREIFDHITYNKGSVVNRMLEDFLGEAVFRKGLSVYLKKYAYKNAKTQDLWDVLETVSKKPVSDVMASYTRQEGYPVIRVEEEIKGESETIRLEQKRFLFDGSKDSKNLAWNIPVQIGGEGLDKNFSLFLKERKKTITLPQVKRQWIKLNAGQGGFYRAAYSPELLRRLSQALKDKAFSPSDELGVLDDAFSLARAGVIHTSEALEIIDSIRHAKDYNVWVTAASALQQTEGVVRDAQILERLLLFSKMLFRPIYDRLGWSHKTSDSHLDILLRSMVIARLGHSGDEEVKLEARKLFQAYLKGSSLDPNLRGPVFLIVAEYGDKEVFDLLMKLYQKTDLQEEKVRLLRALTRFRSAEVVEQALRFALSPNVRKQDAYVLLAGFGSNRAARKTNWHFVKKQWKELRSRYTGGSIGLLGHIFEGAAAGFASKEDFRDVQSFVNKSDLSGIERTAKQTLEIVQSNVAWSERDEDDIRSWLGRNT